MVGGLSLVIPVNFKSVRGEGLLGQVGGVAVVRGVVEVERFEAVQQSDTERENHHDPIVSGRGLFGDWVHVTIRGEGFSIYRFALVGNAKR